MDQVFDCIALGLVARRIELLFEGAPREDGARSRHEGRKQRVLALAERDGFASDAEGVGDGVERKGACAQHVGCERRAAAHHGAKARDELRHVEGLEDVVVRPCIESLKAAFKRLPRRHDDDGRVAEGLRHGADALEDVDAVHAGESQIEEHGVGRAGCDDGEPLAARRGPRDGVRLAFERRADGLGNERIVFDKKDVHDGGRTREAPLSAFRKRKTGGLSPEEGPPA